MKTSWPILDGAYVVGDPAAPVAICTLTSERLADRMARLAGVAIAGQVYTANLGIERIVVNLTANPAIRFLLLCGREMPRIPPPLSWDRKDPFSSFHRTTHSLTVSTTDTTPTAIGTLSDVVTGAIVRVHGVLRPGDRIEAQRMAILTKVATVR